MHRRLHVDAAQVADVREGRVAARERALGGGDEVLEAHAVERVLHRSGIGDVEEAIPAVRRDASAGGHLHLQRERAVGDAVTAEQGVVVPVLYEETGDRAVAEVEHEARALISVIEEIGLAARRDDEDRVDVVLCEEHVARDAKRNRRSARDVVVLDRVRAGRADPVRDPRCRLPDCVVLPHRAVVHDDVDRLRVDAGLREQPLGGAHRKVADVLVLGCDVLAAQAELLDDHLLGDRAPLADLRCGHPPLRQVRRRRGEADAAHAGGSSTRRMMRASSASTFFGTRPSPQRM